MIYNRPSHTLTFEHLLPDDNYFYVDCSKYQTIPELVNYKQICDEKNLTLIVDNSVEGWKSLVDDIYDFLILPHNWNPTKILLVSGDADIENHIAIISNKTNYLPIKSLWSRTFEVMVANQLDANLRFERDVFKKLINRSDLNFEKTYICLNRRWRLHRPALVALLGVKNLLGKGYVSLSQADYKLTWEDVIPGLSSIHKSNQELYDIFTNRKGVIYNIPQLSIDRQTLEETTLFNLERLLCPFYEKSLISVTTETNFYSNCYQRIAHEGTRFLSEKTFKPIAHQLPFILVSVPKSLELLRSIGYKTFHPFINESYDIEMDDSVRLLKIVNEIERLCNFSTEEIKEFVKQTIPICKYNYELLLSRSQIK